MAARAEDIEQILSDMRDAIDNKNYQPAKTKSGNDRLKNMRTLASLGLTWQDAVEEMYELSAGDYFDGPCTDRDFPASDMLWVFKKQVLGQTIYIKFKVEYQISSGVRILSFHFDEIR